MKNGLGLTLIKRITFGPAIIKIDDLRNKKRAL